MVDGAYLETSVSEGGAELTIDAMQEFQRLEIGRKTFNYVRSCLRNPLLREKIQARAAQLREEGERERAANAKAV